MAIGKGSNVQDDAVLGSGSVRVGAGVTIGHGAIIKVGAFRDGAVRYNSVGAVLGGAVQQYSSTAVQQYRPARKNPNV